MSFLYSEMNSNNARAVVEWVERFRTCLFCTGPMRALGRLTRLIAYKTSLAGRSDPDEELVEVTRCFRCGWWAVQSPYLNTGGHVMHEVGYGQLRKLNPDDLSEPVEVLRAHLLLRKDDLLNVHPRKLEELIGSVFKDFGYRSRVTAYSGDGGIDVYLDGETGLVGVQVKRTKNPIEVEQINSLTGALFVNDCASGVFVTTSRFRRGAERAAGKARIRGIPIELWDAGRIFDALEVAQMVAPFDPNDPLNPWMRCEFKEYYKFH